MDPTPPDAGFWIAFVAVMAISLAIGLTLALALYIVNAFALMSLFRKVGVAPWIGWVPYYNTWTVLELGGQAGPLALLSLVFASGCSDCAMGSPADFSNVTRANK